MKWSMRSSENKVATGIDESPELNERNVHGAPLENVEKSRWERSWPTIACGAGLFSDGYLNGYAHHVQALSVCAPLTGQSQSYRIRQYHARHHLSCTIQSLLSNSQCLVHCLCRYRRGTITLWIH